MLSDVATPRSLASCNRDISASLHVTRKRRTGPFTRFFITPHIDQLGTLRGTLQGVQLINLG